MAIVLTVIVVFLLILWMGAHVKLSHSRRGDPFLQPGGELPPDPPMLSIIIPAHDETTNIERTLKSVMMQDYPRMEVIVGADRCTDATTTIVRSFQGRVPQVKVVESFELPPDWVGKAYILQKASGQASGDILMFLDADVRLEPGALRSIIRYMTDRNLEMFSAFLRHESRSLWDEAVHEVVGPTLMLRFPVRKVNDPDSPLAMANGQMIVIRRKVYEEIGKHEQVRSIVQEDLALAKVVKHSGYRLGMAYGVKIAAGRWYGSLGQLWRGWTRIIYGLSEGRVEELISGLLLVTVMAMAPFAILLVAAGMSLHTRLPEWDMLSVLSLLQVGVMMSLMVRFAMVSGDRLRSVLLYPAAACITFLIVFSCLVKRITCDQISWRGKKYRMGPHGLETLTAAGAEETDSSVEKKACGETSPRRSC